MQKFTGAQYLKIDIASNFGLDKKTWNQRINWFDEHQKQIEDPKAVQDLIKQADEPALFAAGVRAWNLCKQGMPSGYPISLDATSSGLQILSALTGDRTAAEICNVVNRIYQEGVEAGVPERADAYTIVYHMMLEVIGEGGKIKREDTKKAIMTALYGSKAQPKEVFGEGLLLSIFYETMNKVAPAAWELNEVFLNIWDPEALEYNWVLPDGFHVKTKVIDLEVETVHFQNEPFEIERKVNRPMEGGRSLGANTVHSIDGMIVREVTARCDYDLEQVTRLRRIVDDVKAGYQLPDGGLLDPQSEKDQEMVQKLWDLYKKSGYLSARILTYLNDTNMHLVDLPEIDEMLQSLPAKPFKVISIHDCFRVLPNYGNDLRFQYTYQLHLIARSNMLSFLLSQVMNREVSVGKADPTMHRDILDAEYALS
jgi:DNA-dependent RNA polymerase